MADELPAEPHMLPLRVRVRPESDEYVVLRLGDEGYLAEYRMAAYDYRRRGRPMPYAKEQDASKAGE